MTEELHLRMCKKIAQLTKVIYHLHNRHEDNEFDMQELADQYEKEIENSNKINSERTTAVDIELQNQQERKHQLETAIQEANCKQEATQQQLQDIQAVVQTLNLRIQQQEAKHAEDCKALQSALAEAQNAADSSQEKYHQICNEKLQVESLLRMQLQQTELALQQLANKLHMEAASKLAAAIAAHSVDMQHLREQFEGDANQMVVQHKSAIDALEQAHQQHLQQQQQQYDMQLAEAVEKRENELQLMQAESLNAKDAIQQSLRQHKQVREALISMRLLAVLSRFRQRAGGAGSWQLSTIGWASSSRLVISQMVAAAESERTSLIAAMAQLQHRFDAREPRPEDVAAIADLKATLAAREEALQTAEMRLHHLRNEMLLREENYNKHFRNGGVGEKVLDVGSAASAHNEVVDWMLKSGNRRMTGDRHNSGARGAGAVLGAAQSAGSPGKGSTASFKR
eukprot:gene10893-11047_t